MTSSNDQIRTAMRAYADTVEPPPVSDVIARAEQPHASHRNSGPMMAAALGIIVVATAALIVSHLTGEDVPRTPATAQSTGAKGIVAPACGPGMPSLDWALTGGKQPTIKPGRSVTIPMRMPTTLPDRRLRTFAAALVPADVHLSPGWPVVAQSAVAELTPDQTTVTLVFNVPARVLPGKYNVIGTATYPSPSLCGHVNPPDSPANSTMEGGIGSVVIG